MSEQEKIILREKINKGLLQSYKNLLHRKAVLGQDIVTADAEGQPLIVPASEMLKRENLKYPEVFRT